MHIVIAIAFIAMWIGLLQGGAGGAVLYAIIAAGIGSMGWLALRAATLLTSRPG